MPRVPAPPFPAPTHRSAPSVTGGSAFVSVRPILYVDDSDIDLMVAAQCYERCRLGNPLITLRGGGALASYLDDLRRGMRSSPALILLDDDMPGLNGAEIVTRIRMQEGFKMPLNILLFSHCEGAAVEERARVAGADGFAPKPNTIAGYVDFFDSLAEHWELVHECGVEPVCDFAPHATQV